MSEFKLEVGKRYRTALIANDKGESMYVCVVGRKSDKKLKVLFVGDNGLEYTADGYVVGYQEHVEDLQPRKVGLK